MKLRCGDSPRADGASSRGASCLDCNSTCECPRIVVHFAVSRRSIRRTGRRLVRDSSRVTRRICSDMSNISSPASASRRRAVGRRRPGVAIDDDVVGMKARTAMTTAILRPARLTRVATEDLVRLFGQLKYPNSGRRSWRIVNLRYQIGVSGGLRAAIANGHRHVLTAID